MIYYFKYFNNNQNEINAAKGEAQLQNILNKTANTSEDNIRRQS